MRLRCSSDACTLGFDRWPDENDAGLAARWNFRVVPVRALPAQVAQFIQLMKWWPAAQGQPALEGMREWVRKEFAA